MTDRKKKEFLCPKERGKSISTKDTTNQRLNQKGVIVDTISEMEEGRWKKFLQVIEWKTGPRQGKMEFRAGYCDGKDAEYWSWPIFRFETFASILNQAKRKGYISFDGKKFSVHPPPKRASTDF